MRLMLVGGGSGGHFYPLMAVAEKLRAEHPTHELYYIGPDQYEPEELSRLMITYLWCPSGKQRRYFSLLNYLDIVKVIGGFFVSLVTLYIIYPDVVFSKGSFTSVPVLLAARFLRIPVVIHESDAVAGRANLLARKFARAIAIAYPEAAQYFPKDKTALIGIPLRSVIADLPNNPRATLGIPDDLPLILITGGSLGAEYLNNLTVLTLPLLLPHYRVFHLCGDSQESALALTTKSLLTSHNEQSRYYLKGSVPGEIMAALLAVASLVVSRAGSTAIHEIAHYRKPAILIPIPETVSRDQRTNAYAYARTGAASVLEQGNLTPHLLMAEINAIMGDRARYDNMQTAARGFAMSGAAHAVANILTTVGTTH